MAVPHYIRFGIEPDSTGNRDQLMSSANVMVLHVRDELRRYVGIASQVAAGHDGQSALLLLDESPGAQAAAREELRGRLQDAARSRGEPDVDRAADAMLQRIDRARERFLGLFHERFRVTVSETDSSGKFVELAMASRNVTDAPTGPDRVWMDPRAWYPPTSSYVPGDLGNIRASSPQAAAMWSPTLVLLHETNHLRGFLQPGSVIPADQTKGDFKDPYDEANVDDIDRTFEGYLLPRQRYFEDPTAGYVMNNDALEPGPGGPFIPAPGPDGWHWVALPAQDTSGVHFATEGPGDQAPAPKEAMGPSKAEVGALHPIGQDKGVLGEAHPGHAHHHAEAAPGGPKAPAQMSFTPEEAGLAPQPDQHEPQPAAPAPEPVAEAVDQNVGWQNQWNDSGGDADGGGTGDTGEDFYA